MHDFFKDNYFLKVQNANFYMWNFFIFQHSEWSPSSKSLYTSFPPWCGFVDVYLDHFGWGQLLKSQPIEVGDYILLIMIQWCKTIFQMLASSSFLKCFWRIQQHVNTLKIKITSKFYLCKNSKCILNHRTPFLMFSIVK
jgi:hypothetical protein